MVNCWVIKPKRDLDGRKEYENNWKNFIDEKENRGNKVIAIGWSLGTADSSNNLNQLRQYMNSLYTKPMEANIAANTIWKFIMEMKKGDEVICDGYTFQQKSDVLVYGIARITGEYWEDKDCPWFQRKRNIELLNKIEKRVPKELLADSLGLKTLLKTIHEIKNTNFNNTKKRIIEYALDFTLRSL
jgi:predicted Mrr-cat superfamily restriction endonuclease